jgi:hypothetical protein
MMLYASRSGAPDGEGADVGARETGRWLVWGGGTATDVHVNVIGDLGSALASAVSGLKPVGLDDNPAADSDRSAPDCGEGDLFGDLPEDTTLIALIHEQDSDWTPPGYGDPADSSGRTSWMKVVRNATEAEIQAKVAAHGTAARGYLRLI